MNEPLNWEDDTSDLNEAVMESAALQTELPVPPVAVMGWDQPVGSEGSRAPIPHDTAFEDIARQMVDAGNEEAGREQRIAAEEQTPSS